MGWEAPYCRSLSRMDDGALASRILALAELIIDNERDRQAAPRLKAKFRMCVNERRKRRIARCTFRRGAEVQKATGIEPWLGTP
jgi:hypothetical protein